MIEIHTYRLDPALADADDVTTFIAADAEYQQGFAYQQPGLRRRTTGRGADGTWVTITWWDRPEDADAARAAGSASDLARRFEAMRDPESQRIERFDELAG